MTEAEHSQLVLESKITLLKLQLNSGDDPFENPDVIAFGTLSKLKEDKEELIVKRDQLSSKYLKRHPLVVENDKLLESLDKRILLNIKALVQKLNNELSEVKSNKIELSRHLMALDEDAKKLNVLYVESDRLQFEIQSNQESLKSITERQREIEITSRLDSINVKIADRANIPQRPLEPDLKKTAVLAFCLAIMLFIGVPLGLDAMDNQVTNRWDITNLLDVELLAQIGT